MQPRLWAYVGGIGISQIKRTVDYILNQEKHHAKRSFVQEWKMFLKRHELVDYED